MKKNYTVTITVSVENKEELDSLFSVLGSGLGAEGVGAAGQRPVELSEGPSDATVAGFVYDCTTCVHGPESPLSENCKPCMFSGLTIPPNWVRR